MLGTAPGKDVNETVPAIYRRVLSLLVRARLHESVLDAHHVGTAHAVPETTRKPYDRHLRVLVSLDQQLTEFLVSVRGIAVRFVPGRYAVQVVQIGAGDVNGQDFRQQELQTVRLRRRDYHRDRYSDVHDVNGRSAIRVRRVRRGSVQRDVDGRYAPLLLFVLRQLHESIPVEDVPATSRFKYG